MFAIGVAIGLGLGFVAGLQWGDTSGLAWVLWVETIAHSGGMGFPEQPWGAVDAWETKAECETGKIQFMNNLKISVTKDLGLKVEICKEEETPSGACMLGPPFEDTVLIEGDGETALTRYVCFPETIDPREKEKKK